MDGAEVTTEVDSSVGDSTGNTDAGDVGLNEAVAEAREAANKEGDEAAKSLEDLYEEKPTVEPVEQPEAKDEPETEPEQKKEESVEDKSDDDAFGDLQIPEDLPVSAESLDAFKGAFKELGLDTAGAQRLIDMQADHVRAEQAAIAAENAKWTADLKKELGESYDSTIRAAAQGVVRFDETGEAWAVLDGMGLTKNPAVVKLFANIQRQTGEDTAVVGGSTGSNGQEGIESLYTSKM